MVAHYFIEARWKKSALRSLEVYHSDVRLVNWLFSEPALASENFEGLRSSKGSKQSEAIAGNRQHAGNVHSIAIYALVQNCQ